MKGKLKKTEQGWVVKHLGYVPPHEYELPLHPVNQLKLLNDRDGEEVEFEPIEDYRYKVNGFGLTYAKLIKLDVMEKRKQQFSEYINSTLSNVREDDVEELATEWLLSKICISGKVQGSGLSVDEIIEQAREMELKAKENTFTEGQIIGFAEWISKNDWMSIWVEDKWMWEYQSSEYFEELPSSHKWFGYKTNEQLFNLYIQSLKQPKND